MRHVNPGQYWGDQSDIGCRDRRTAVGASPWQTAVRASLLASTAHCDAVSPLSSVSPPVIVRRQDPWVGLYERPIGTAAIRTLTSPYNMGFTVARNMALSCLVLAHTHIVLLTEAEEKAIENNCEPEYVPFPWDDLPDVLKRGAVNSCMDVTVLSTRGVLDYVVKSVLSSGSGTRTVVTRMHTDMRRTTRALAPAYPFAERFTRVVKTALWSEITLYLSEFVVTSVLDAVRVVRAGGGVGARVGERVVAKVAVNCARCATLWVAVSVGNGVGASSPKARGLCMLVGANAAALLVNMYYRRVWARVERQLFGGDASGEGASGGDASGGDASGGDEDSEMEVIDVVEVVEVEEVIDIVDSSSSSGGGEDREADGEFQPVRPSPSSFPSPPPSLPPPPAGFHRAQGAPSGIPRLPTRPNRRPKKS